MERLSIPPGGPLRRGGVGDTGHHGGNAPALAATLAAPSRPAASLASAAVRPAAALAPASSRPAAVAATLTAAALVAAALATATLAAATLISAPAGYGLHQLRRAQDSGSALLQRRCDRRGHLWSHRLLGRLIHQKHEQTLRGLQRL